MTGWYAINPSGPITLGNLTPVGQNSGLVGCRWPPNGHQLAGCIELPTHCQMWGPFWYYSRKLYLPLPLTVYTTDPVQDGEIPSNIYRLRYNNGLWQTRPEHEDEEIQIIGGQYLISVTDFQLFWKAGELEKSPEQEVLVKHPWETLTLSHNSRDDYQVKEEGGFFAEMTTFLSPGWSIAFKIIGDYQPSAESCLGAGGTPVTITSIRGRWDWLGDSCENATGAVLLTGALWEQPTAKASLPYPNLPIKAYAADAPIPWQSWKKVKDRNDPEQQVSILTPGQWLTPAGAVYLWQGEPPVSQSGPLADAYHRDALGYGHLWLFEE